MKEEISKVVKIQEELDIDVLVHGEPEVSGITYMVCCILICKMLVWTHCDEDIFVYRYRIVFSGNEAFALFCDLISMFISEK